MLLIKTTVRQRSASLPFHHSHVPMLPQSGPNHGGDPDNRPIYLQHLIGRTTRAPDARGILCRHSARDTASQPKAVRARGTGVSHV